MLHFDNYLGMTLEFSDILNYRHCLMTEHYQFAVDEYVTFREDMRVNIPSYSSGVACKCTANDVLS